MAQSKIDLNTLNAPQRSAVESVHGPLIILAGAGTGKTRVITYRVAHMLNLGLDPSTIVAMTFTNKAAREMKERIHALSGAQAKGVHVGTFHSFCLKTLRQYASYTSLDRMFSLVGTPEQLNFVKKSLDEKGWKGLFEPDVLLSQISRCKNLLLAPHEVTADSLRHAGIDESGIQALSIVYELYQRQLRLNRVIDFDDCIFEFIRLLQAKAELRERINQKLKYFLIDEFQDTNYSQLEALRLLAETSQNACVVGDDDQSIYSWRGAEPRIIEAFETIFPKSKLIKLEQNYRCSPKILGAANAVISNNISRKPKLLWSDSKISEDILLSSHQDEASEAKWIAQKCFGLLGQNSKLGDIGILYRTNGQSKALEVALRECNLKYRVFGGTSFFEKKEIKDFLAYFKLTLDPDHRLSYWRIINSPVRGIGLKTQEQIEDEAKRLKVSPFRAGLEISSSIKGSAGRGLESLNENLKELSSVAITRPDQIKERAQRIISLFKLEADIRVNTKNERARQKKIEMLAKMPDWLQTIAMQSENSAEFDIHTFIDSLLLGEDQKPTSKNDEDDRISLMTIHSAKGLEFKIVFLPGLEDDILPHRNSESPAAVAEERRLFYVALTRAKKQLFLSYAFRRNAGFQKLIKKPSRFLKEIPQEGLQIISSEADEAIPTKEQNIQRLSSLKEQLKLGFKHR